MYIVYQKLKQPVSYLQILIINMYQYIFKNLFNVINILKNTH